MKKAVSYFLIFSMLLGMLSSFSFAVEVDSPYSGGSGTEEDPYIISCAGDIYELRNNVLNEPSLYGMNAHYKLVNDIKITEGISPVYEFNMGGKHCSVKSEYDVKGVKKLLEDYTEDEFEEWYNGVVSQIGYLYRKIEIDYGNGYETSLNKMYGIMWFESYIDWVYEDKDPGFDTALYLPFYRNAAFTGVFDGNGHSIELQYKAYSENYLFGFLENGAVVKDLELLGECASLAYQVDETSEISNCVVNTDSTYAEIYDVFVTNEHDSYEIAGGAIVYNYGTVKNCVNFAKGISGLIGYNINGTVINCANYGEVIIDGEGLGYRDYNMKYYLSLYARENYDYMVRYPELVGICGGKQCIDYVGIAKVEKGDGYFTANECEISIGNLEAFKNEGFDFENEWLMKDGLPVLRLFLETGTGDLNLDGVVNSIDSCLVKRYLAGVGVGIEYVNVKAADMDKDNTVNALDSALLKLTLVGK